MNTLRSILFKILPSVVAIILTLAVGGLVVFLMGRNPGEVAVRFAEGTFGSAYGIGQILFKATPLICTGLAAAVSFRSGLFNIGAEGQLAVGGFVTAWIGFSFPGLPGVVLLPMAILGGMVGGAAWGAIPGLLKARFGAHEVINTIMMNFIAAALVSYLVNNLFAVQGTMHTPEIGVGADIPRLGIYLPFFQGSPVNVSLLLALTACVVVWYLFWKTRLGYELRTLGHNPHAARYAGIPIGSRTITAMAIAGACAALGGTNFIMGYKHYYELGFSENTGFIGIAVALLGNNHPAGIVLAALLFGTLDYGGLTVNTMVPKEIVNILQGLIIILVIVLTKVLDKWMISAKISVKKPAGEANA